MSATLQQMYLWALRDAERLEAYERIGALTPGQRHALDCASGAVRVFDACLSDTVILDRLKAVAARKAAAARAPAQEAAS